MSEFALHEKYILEHSTPEADYLRELERETNLKVLNPRMLSGRLQGRILSMISGMIHPSNILEIGTYTGYSALCLSEGLAKGGMLHTIEINDELESIAQRYFKKAGMQEQIIQHIGDACEVMKEFTVPFDLVFIDADKREYCDYYSLVIDKVTIGAYILVDNVLWNGKVLDTFDPNDEQASGIQLFNDMIAKDHRVKSIILPIRDGITIIQKIAD